jgi:outer membrane autotransporter protein
MNSTKAREQRYKRLLKAAYVAALLASSVSVAPTFAADRVWDGDISSDWNTAGNWNPTTVPTAADTAIFGGEGADQTGVGLSANSSAGETRFDFNGLNPQYTISTNAFRLSIDGTGVTNNSGQTQTFNVNNAAGILRFRNSAQIFENGFGSDVVINNNSGGLVRFEDSSNAGSAEINNSNGSATRFFMTARAGSAVINNTLGGDTEFNGTSSADDATITNDGAGSTTTFNGGGRAGTSEILNRNDGTTVFNGNSRAESSEITNRDGGSTTFNDDANGNTAFIINRNGGSLFINDSADTGNMTVENRDGGTVDISGTSGAGAGIGQLFGDGNVILGTQTLRTGMLNQDATISGVISGTGGLTKEGSATLRLNNDNSYTGQTTINNGTLQVDGNIDSTETVINNDLLGTVGRLSGTGEINGNVTNNGGRIAPGRGFDALGNSNIYGDLNVNGNVNLNGTNGSESRLETRVNGLGDVNRLEATGTVNLAGGVEVTAEGEDQPNGNVYLVNNRYRIITGDSGRTGTFDQGITSFNNLSAADLDASLDYNATSAFLVLRRNSLLDHAGNFSDNQGSVFGAFNQAIENGNPLSPNNEALINNFLLNGNKALDLAGGDALTTFPIVAQGVANRFNQKMLLQALQQYQENAQMSASRPSGRMAYTGDRYRTLLAQGDVAPAAGTMASDASNVRRSNIWASIGRAKDNGDSDGNGPGYDARATEYQVGVSRNISDRTVVGLAIGKSDGSVDIDDRSAEGDLDTTSAGVFARHDNDNFYVSGLFSYSRHSIDSQRATGIGTANADYDARTLALWGEVGKKMEHGRWNIEPNISLKLSNTKQDDFSESGPGGLSVDSNNYNSRRLGLGVRLTTRDAGARIRPNLFVGYEREFGDDNAELTNSLGGGISAFNVNSTELGKNIFSLRLGADARVSDRFSLIGEVGGSWRSNQNSSYIYGGVKYGW